MICPQCEAEYVSSVAECSGCRVALVEPAPDPIPLGDAAVEAAQTADGAEVRGWRAALTHAGVTHRIEVEAGTPPVYTLLVGEADRAWAEALAAVLVERPSLEAQDAVRHADARLSEHAEDDPEPDEADFDVPDLIPPPDIKGAIEAAESVATALIAGAVLLLFVAVAFSPWWGVLGVIAALESVRARRRAQTLRAAWQQENGEASER